MALFVAGIGLFGVQGHVFFETYPVASSGELKGEYVVSFLLLLARQMQKTPCSISLDHHSTSVSRGGFTCISWRTRTIDEIKGLTVPYTARHNGYLYGRSG